MDDGIVLVIGSSGLDIKAQARVPLEPGLAIPGVVRNTVGGAARNVAENLARLEVPTTLLSIIGTDVPGKRVLSACQRAGIETRYIRRMRGTRTSSYVAMLDTNGDMLYAVADFETIEQHLTAAFIAEHEHLFQDAALIVIDANMSEAAIDQVFALAERHHVRVSADPTTPTNAAKLCPYLSQLYLIVPNAAETGALCSVGDATMGHDEAIQAARAIVALGTEIAVVTLGDSGLTYADAGGGGYIRAVRTNVVDTTGAGDALTGAVIFGLLNGVEVDEAMRLGVTAASLTLESTHTVLPELTQELLYSKLMI